MDKRDTFKFRNFVTLLVAGCFLILVVTGIILFIVPPGRVANWTDWTLFFLSKHEWSAIHITVSLLFVSAAIFHLVLNWRVFTHYVASKLKAVDQKRHLRREGVWATLILLFVVTGSIINLPPFSWIMNTHETLRNSWFSTQITPAPFGHAEELSFKDLANQLQFDEGEAIDRLKSKGIIIINKDQTLREISDLNKTQPARLYSIMAPSPNTDTKRSSTRNKSDMIQGGMKGSGLGRSSVSEVAASLGIDVGEALSRLSSSGIEAHKGDLLRDLSTDTYRPVDLKAIIERKPE